MLLLLDLLVLLVIVLFLFFLVFVILVCARTVVFILDIVRFVVVVFIFAQEGLCVGLDDFKVRKVD